MIQLTQNRKRFKANHALRRASALAAALFLGTQFTQADTIWLDDLNLNAAVQGWGKPQKNTSVDKNPLSIAGQKFERGFGTHAESTLGLHLGGGATKFTASVGVDDEVGTNKAASVEFSVIGDGKTLWTSGVMHAGEAAKSCEVNISGVNLLILEVGDAGNGISFDHADWANAKFETKEGKTVATGSLLPTTPYILTPPPPHTPRINGASVFGVRPGSPFLYTIPATGDRPMEFAVKNLPEGLQLDPKTGLITGKLEKAGEYAVVFIARNALGQNEKKFRIVCGNTIALTPPMGWNSWNCFAHAVSADHVKRAADMMVKSGLINHGWTYINIDDFWQNHKESNDPTLQGDFRDANGNIIPNKRFPDMKGLADYVHGLGLKIGLYSSPGPWTCGNCAGSWKHEKLDAEQYARWGYDYLKYDWCSYGGIAHNTNSGVPVYRSHTDVEGAIYPYKLMGEFISQQKRDIVFSLCQYGMSDVWKWGNAVNGSCWRTTGDIEDTWGSMSSIGFNQDKAAPFARPGNWNDPDMLIVGEVGWGNLHPTRLTPDEQYTHISLWCLLSAPLLIGCDMEKLDEFTLNLLSNDEVIAIDQDVLGKQATCVMTNGSMRVYAKTLEDGSRAVGFFNLSYSPMKLDFDKLAAIGFAGKQQVRDVWRQKDLQVVDSAKDALPLTIPGHGVVLYKFTEVK